MQPLALLWFELQVAQQSLRESFAAGQRVANAANLDAPSTMATRRAASEKQLPRIKSVGLLEGVVFRYRDQGQGGRSSSRNRHSRG